MCSSINGLINDFPANNCLHYFGIILVIGAFSIENDGGILVITPTTSFFQIFCEFMLNSRVICGSIISPDGTCSDVKSCMRSNEEIA